MTSYSINLLFINEHQCLESSLHTILVAMSGKPPASFQVVKNNLCLKGMHKIFNTLPKRSIGPGSGFEKLNPRLRELVSKLCYRIISQSDCRNYLPHST